MTIYFIDSKKGLSKIKPDDLKKYLTKKNGFLWLDIENPKLDDINLLSGSLGIHAAALENLMEGYQPPVIINEEYHAFVIPAASLAKGKRVYKTNRIGFLISDRYLVTIHQQEAEWLSSLASSIGKSPQFIGNTPWLLFFRIARKIIDEAKMITGSWENLLKDIAFEERTDFENLDIPQFLKIRFAAGELAKNMMETSEIIEVMAAEISEALKPDDKIVEIEQFRFKWNGMIERALGIKKRIESAIDIFQNVGLQKQRKIFSLLLNLNLLFLPIAVILLLSLIVFPGLDLPYNIRLIVWPIASLLLGAGIGAALIHSFKP